MNQLQRTLMFVSSMAVSAVLFQNCTPFEIDPNKIRGSIYEFGSSGGGELQPASDKYDTGCMSSSAYDSCIVRKNPQSSKAERSLSSAAPAATAQIYGVKLTGVLSTGFLENNTISVDTVIGSRVSTYTNTLKFQIDDASHGHDQVLAYYWINRAAEYLHARTGVLPAKDKGIKVFVQDSFGGFAPRSNSIHLRRDGMSSSAEFGIYYFGLANLHHASDGAAGDIANSNKHRLCDGKEAGCCTSSNGCARAIASGVGDYFVAVMFPDRPIVGEELAQNNQGLVRCMIRRNLTTIGSITAQMVFDSCPAIADRGDVTLLGSVYASIWWRVRIQAASRDATGERDIDALFMHHLAEVRGSDDFKTLLPKIKSIDSRLFNGRYSPLFDAEFATRGL